MTYTFTFIVVGGGVYHHLLSKVNVFLKSVKSADLRVGKSLQRYSSDVCFWWAKRVTKYRYTLVRGATNIRASGNSNGVLVGRGA